jgi:cell division protein FtsI/penicillin-binding protein 2
VRTIDRRIGLLFGIFLLFFCTILVRSVWLQGVRGGELSADARGQQVAQVVVPGTRGRILDRNGNELAISEDAATIIATPYQVEDPTKAASKLAPVLDLEEDKLLETLADEDSGFAYLVRKADLSTAEKVRQLGIEGIGILPDSRRVYPEGVLAAQVIGGVGVDNQGLTGLEAGYEELLHGTDGEREVVLDALGDELERDTLAPPTTGEELQLTLDAALQARTEQVLAGIGEAWNPAGATAIVINPQTSDVLAMANWPALDPTDLGSAQESELVNRATGFNYEPGSTFKAFTVAGALEEGLVTPRTEYDLAPTIQVADRVIEESHPRAATTLTVADILAQSSNVGSVTIGLELGPERFDHWVRMFGFGEPTGIGIPGEESGIVLRPEDYYGSSMGNLPIGQGISVTPMQMVAGYAAIANGGILRPPRLIMREGAEELPPAEGERVMSEKSAAQLSKMLEGVLAPGGTASEVSVPGYTLAGKTGTAQKAEDGGYSETDYVGSFVGFAPADDPQLLVAVVVDEPTGVHYGSVVAAPAFAEIASFALPYLGIAPE